MNRRNFFKSATALALVAASPAYGFLPRGGLVSPSGFNGGKSQGQSTVDGGDFPYINLLKSEAGFGWWGSTSGVDNNVNPDPALFDTNGYPLSSTFPTNGFIALLSPPNGNTHPATSLNPLVVYWKGMNASVNVAIFNNAINMVSGTNNSASTFNPATGFYEGTFQFYPTYDSNGVCSFNYTITAMAATSTLTEIALYYLENDTLYKQGKIFNPKYVQRITDAKFGVWRFMDWFSANNSNATTWATRKSQNYPFWRAHEYRASLSIGVTTGNSGNDYTASSPGTYSWPGYNKTAYIDKQTFHLRFNANATYVANQQNQTLTVSLAPSTNLLTFGWPSNPVNNGDPIAISTQAGVGGNQPENTATGIVYYAVGRTSSQFNVALTPGGAPIVSNNVGGGNVWVGRLPTLNLDGLGAVPITGNLGAAPNDPSFVPGSNGVNIWGTVVYDATLNCLMLSGGQVSGTYAGLVNIAPPEVCLELAKEIGCHPHWSAPPMALDGHAGPTDYVSGLIALSIAGNPGWMVPHYEPNNEVWNTFQPNTIYANAKAQFLWGANANVNSWYGMVLSNMGQKLKSLYGSGTLGTAYECMCGVQTDGGLGLSVPGLSDERITATNYVASGPSFAGYSQMSAASLTSAGLCADYVSPAQRGKIAELQNAWNWSQSAQVSNLDDYANSLSQTISGTATFTSGSATIGWPSNVLSASGFAVVQFGAGCPAPFVAKQIYYVLTASTSNLTVAATAGGTPIVASTGGSSAIIFAPFAASNQYEYQRYLGYKAWGARLGLSPNKLFAYEGGYSPDLMGASVDYRSGFWSSFQSSPESTLPFSQGAGQGTVFTINNVSGNDNGDGGRPQSWGGNPQVGNPALAGMLIAFDMNGSLGWPEFKNQRQVAGVVFNFGGATQTWTAHNLHVNERIIFSPWTGPAPTNVNYGQAYYITSVPTANTFTFSATKGGPNITPSGTSATASIVSGFTVISVSGSQVVVDCDSSGFSTPTGSMYATYPYSIFYINQMRVDTLYQSTTISAQLRANYDNFNAAGGLFPSQYEFAGATSVSPATGQPVAGSVWNIITPDVWGTVSQEYNMIAAFNN